MSLRAIWYSTKDNVATAIGDLVKGNRIKVECGKMILDIKLDNDIPEGHKFALKEIPKGQKIVKYNESIGRATVNISQGAHVHVHNVESCRARGDLRGRK